MTADEVIRMAREVGMVVVPDQFSMFPFLQRFAALCHAQGQRDMQERAAEVCAPSALIDIPTAVEIAAVNKCKTAIRALEVKA